MNYDKVSTFEEVMFTEEVKQWIKESRSLKATLISLRNIVWEQCSKLIQNKQLAVANFNTIQAESYVAKLLRAIQGISNQMESNTSIHDA